MVDMEQQGSPVSITKYSDTGERLGGEKRPEFHPGRLTKKQLVKFVEQLLMDLDNYRNRARHARSGKPRTGAPCSNG
jgi:hypothetical protein